jgi:CRISPR-associated protein (TIGR02584 family)
MNTLFQILGLTPQVVTETLWALRQKGIIINRLHLFTTIEGHKNIKKCLINKNNGMLHKFIREYKMPESLNEPYITIAKYKSEDLPDLRTADHIAVVADQILDIVRKETSNPKDRVCCSIAGGRKSMDVIAAFAMQIYGRRNDMLCHVLADKVLEHRKDFYYPSPKQDGFKGVTLAEIPFLRLRNILNNEQILAGESYNKLVERLQYELEIVEARKKLIIDAVNGTVNIGENKLPMSSRLMTYYLFFAFLKKHSCVEPERELCGKCTECFLKLTKHTKMAPELIEQWKNAFDAAEGRLKDFKEFEKNLKGGEFENLARTNISRINSAIIRKLGKKAVDFYGIKSYGRRAETCYGLPLEKKLIETREL